MKINPVLFGSILLALLTLASCSPDRLTAQRMPAPVRSTSTPSGEMGAATSPAWWQPPVQLDWQWQLTGDFVDEIDADVYDLDLFEADPQRLRDLKGKGKRLICYINVGAWEDWRPDRDRFPNDVLGNDYAGWAGELWLDIRQLDTFEAVILERFDLCARLGFDAIEPDNIDGYANETGFPLTAEDQLRYNRWLAEEAHARGLSIGLKNDPDQAASLVADFDWAMTEDCFAEGWCEAMLPFIESGKPVLAAEYTDTGLDFNQACIEAKNLQVNLILKNRALDGFREVCR